MLNRKNKKDICTTAEAGFTNQNTAFSAMSEKQEEPFGAKKSQAWELFLSQQQARSENMIEDTGTEMSAEKRTIPLKKVVRPELSAGTVALSEEIAPEINPGLPFSETEPAASNKRKRQRPGFKKDQSAPHDNKSRTPAEEKNKRILLLCIVIFAVIVAGSAFFIHWRLAADRAAIDAIVEQRMAELSASNTASLEDINSRLSAIEGQMTEIVDILEITDKSISSSSSANREAMAKQIQELDKQMAKLKESINLLLESKAK